MRNITQSLLGVLLAGAVCFSANAQYYPEGYYSPYQYGTWDNVSPQGQGQWRQPSGAHPMANLQYDQRDAERILRDQVARTQGQGREYNSPQTAQQSMYESYYGHRIQDEGQVHHVMAEARNIAHLVTKRNGKAFVVIDKRNFQFYLYDRNGKLLRIGPVAVGKGRTSVGAFETPVGVFPIQRKVPVDDWIRPDWYFVEEGEPIPQRWEDRRVPGFFRYKLVVDGTRYIHYAEATGGRLTHGCLGLDWEDAEAVYHTLEVGSYCIVVDGPFLSRLARGEFPIRTASKPKSPEGVAVAANEPGGERSGESPSQGSRSQERVFQSLW
ncbi:MAG: L,D-transpeptidase [Thermodesulfobacteriota bacterium]